MGTQSFDDLSPGALRMRDSIEQRLFAMPPARRRRGVLPLLVAFAVAVLACVLALR